MSELNGTAVNRIKGAKVKAPRKGKPAGLPGGVNVWRRRITVAAGCGIPLLSLSLSSIGGGLLVAGSYALGSAALLLCGAILSVSLSHLAAALGDITRSSQWQSWAMAIAIDASLVLCELAAVAGHGGFLTTTVMIAVTLASAALNCWAFLRHK